jgi:hypothetical protein
MARQIVVELIGDPKKLTKSFDDAGKSAEGFGGKLKSIGKVAAVGALAVGAAVVATGLKVFEMGSQFEAMDAKAKTVFGDATKTVDKWAAANAAAMGLTKREATGLAASMGDLLIPMGFTRDAAAEMSTSIVGLSGALSEWTGGQRSAAEVSTILQKALLGERDGLKELGISITEADVQARLLKNGQDELTGSALEQAKAMATQQLIMEKTTDAQAAYEKGTAKGIRAQNEMNAMLKEVAETLVTNLYPIVLTVAKWMRENLPKAIKTAQEAWERIQPAVKTVINFLGEVAKVVLPAVGKAVGFLVDNFQKYWPTISGIVHTAIKFIAGYIGTVITVFKNIITTVATVRQNVQDAFTGIVNFVKGIPSKMSSALSNMFRPVWTGFRNFINMLIRGWNSLKFTMPSVDLGPLGRVGGFTIGTPNIPTLHAGGIVPGVPGSDVPAILQAGERVIPRKDVGRGGITINFNGPVYGSDQFIDDFTRKVAMRLRTAGG